MKPFLFAGRLLPDISCLISRSLVSQGCEFSQAKPSEFWTGSLLIDVVVSIIVIIIVVVVAVADCTYSNRSVRVLLFNIQKIWWKDTAAVTLGGLRRKIIRVLLCLFFVSPTSSPSDYLLFSLFYARDVAAVVVTVPLMLALVVVVVVSFPLGSA